MGLFDGRVPHCKQCGCELEGGEEVCPRCGFDPRSKGLRVSMGFFMIVIVAMSLLLFVPSVLPTLVPALIATAILSFAFSLLIFLLSFVATPYRLGSLFTWF